MTAVTIVTREDVERAASRIAGHVRRTPVAEVEPGLFLKLEGMQHSGSFKVRGGFNRILAAAEARPLPEGGVIAASGGNHGMAVAYAARALGIRAEIFVPEVCAPVKVEGLRRLGAHVTQTGAVYADAYEASQKRAAETGALEIHAYDQLEVAAGQGSVAIELLEQAGDLDTVLVAVGGGGLVTGVVAGLAGRAKVVAVEPERIPTLHRALEAGEPVRVEVSGVGADALGASMAGRLAFATVSGQEAGRFSSVLVTDDAIVEARRALWRDHRVAAEHAGAAALAALRSGVYVPENGERVAVIVCGANTDPATLA
ncbi:threonine/serine dehydratase [Planotetraspora sp. A-T 1434]|uniref:threonine/serine dehydratase n=1 Tax=Planotetraspora sp. A-T 1434 TaxID=2979219 RepID=UPI0021BFCE1C|nr:threonine/serine dehydratase [Planotetraspora sp. A-T 1434]MCT9930031.1 threonine/serine dehydratase [Planotetraspora sp. A-T 1434]